MKIHLNTDPITPGRRYFLELVSIDGNLDFSVFPHGRITLNPSLLPHLHTSDPCHPPFNRCVECAFAKTVASAPRNVTCHHNPKAQWSKMSKACNLFIPIPSANKS